MTAVLFSWGKNMKTKQKKKNGATVQSLIGIKGFTEYGLLTTNGEMLFFTIIPTNISVLSYESVENKVRKLTFALSAVPDVEIRALIRQSGSTITRRILKRERKAKTI